MANKTPEFKAPESPPPGPPPGSRPIEEEKRKSVHGVKDSDSDTDPGPGVEFVDRTSNLPPPDEAPDTEPEGGAA